MDKVSQPSQEVNPLATIVAEANATGRMIKHQTIRETEKGAVVLRADQRGYLIFELWRRGEGPSSRLVIAYWNVNTSLWTLSTSQERTQEWLNEVSEFLGESPLPQPIDPIDQAAADFVAQAGTDYDGRVARAVELAKDGHAHFPQYETTFNPAGSTGFYQCACPDAAHRNVRSFIGQTCKHTITLWLLNQVSQAAETVATRKLSDRLELARQRQAIPAGVDRGSIEDYL